MKSIFKRLLSIAIIASAALFVACEIDEGDKVYTPELGAVDEDNIFTVDYQGGNQVIDVFASQPYIVEVVKGNNWIRLGTEESDLRHQTLSLSGDGSFIAAYHRNEGTRRMGIITLSAENRVDSVFIKQTGRTSSTLEVSNRSMLVEYQGGQCSTLLKSSVDFDDLKIDIDYGEEATSNWISNIECVNNTLNFDVDPNPNAKSVRKATVRFSYTDDWAETISTEIVVTQDKEVSITENILSFAEMRQKGERDIVEDVCIEGYVVSDPTYGNAGPNTPITSMRIDYTGTKRIVYLESLDGRYGFMVEFKAEKDNILKRYDKVRLNLNGCYFGKEGSSNVADKDPIRYYINEITAANILSVESGSDSTIPHKEKFFHELTDEDVYTYVTLKDCEFPIKKGPLTPLNEGYTGGGVATIFTANRISQYPLLVRDSHGNSFYTVTNTTCTYRRSGEKLPYGSGTLSGVIVHEACDRLEWDSAKQAEMVAEGYSLDQIYNLGNIGRYQIRHQSKSDIAMASTVAEAKTAIICEFAYYNKDRTDCAVNVDPYYKMYYPQYNSAATATLSHSSESTVSGASAWYFLGDSKNTQAVGSGVVDANGVKVDGKQISSAENSSAGSRGTIDASYGCAWTASKWINGSSYHYWLVEFSTASALGSHLSMQFAACNLGIGAPRYWNVEWSTDKSKWTKAAEYTVPDVAQWSYTAYWQLCGYKHINIELPDELFGQEKVYIRLIPNSGLAGETMSYDGGIAADKSSGLAYLTIRYTK